MTETPLALGLAEALFRKLGSDLHLEIAGFLRGADKFETDVKTTRDLEELSSTLTWSVESNMDLMVVPDRPTWVEMVVQKNEEGDTRTGFLILPRPDNSDVFMVLTALSGPTVSPRHCFAMAIVDMTHIRTNAALARNRYSKAPDESFERIMRLVGVSMNSEFEEELLLVEDGNRQVIDAAMKDATAGLPLLFTFLVALGSHNGFEREYGSASTKIISTEKPSRSRAGRLHDRMHRRLSFGFVRSKGRGGVPKIRCFL